MKLGPSSETENEARALADFLGWESADVAPPFTVISTVSLKNAFILKSVLN